MSIIEPVQDGPWAGWFVWKEPVADTFLNSCIGPAYSRPDGEGRAIVMLESRRTHQNRMGAFHGGFLAAFADHAYFSAIAAMGRPEQADAVTVDLTMQFLGQAKAGAPLRADVEMLKETGRLFFMRMSISHEGQLVAASTATIRKAPTPK